MSWLPSTSEKSFLIAISLNFVTNVNIEKPKGMEKFTEFAKLAPL